jgi:hypothetical protein
MRRERDQEVKEVKGMQYEKEKESNKEEKRRRK